MSLGEVLRRARREARLTQREVGKRAGCAGNEISRYERGLKTPRVERVVSLAGAVGITVDCLVSGVPPGSQNRMRLEDDEDRAALAAILRLDPVQRAAVQAFVEGLALSGSLDSALVAAKAAEAIERGRRLRAARAVEPGGQAHR